MTVSDGLNARAGAQSMQTILSLAVEFVLVAIAVSNIQLLVLVFRNPLRPEWLRHSFVESTAVICIVMGITLSIAILASGLIASGMNVFVSLVLSTTWPFVVAIANWRVFRIGERLRRADMGASPFGSSSSMTPVADPARRASA
jgi:drug/metabolite transporter (DMT)-like permease